MRYFLVSATAFLESQDISNTFTIKGGKFPSHSIIKKMTLDGYDTACNPMFKKQFTLIIHNVFEFKDEKDYNDYHEKETEPIEKEMD